MEDESFEDEEVAKLLNKYYVPIKVDREERPDIDAIYMTACQAFTGQGGWPLSIFLTPDQHPFYAGTYFPKLSRYGMPGFMDILRVLAEKWATGKEEIEKSGKVVTDTLKQQNQAKEEGEPSQDTIDVAVAIFEKSFDEKYGGFGKSPKFPTPHNLMFLLRYYHFEEDEQVLQMVTKTLKQMYRGGIFDHIGYGFSRYSTDDKWLVPHFEKMLYDNALLAIAYLETFQITKEPFFKEVAEQIFTYVFREMTDEEGGFYSAQDADSEGVEGKYYVFTPDEIKSVLEGEDGDGFNQYFDITSKGNFEGKSIPNLLQNKNFVTHNPKLDVLKEKLYAYRKGRTTLRKDDKILTSWNGLMIVALSKAYQILQEEKYLQAARKTVNFMQTRLMDENKRLFVRYRHKDAAGLGHLDDYAFMVWGLTELYHATFEATYLEQALWLNQKMKELFFDEENGGFYLSGKDAENLIYRPKEIYDGAIPSGNSVAAYNLIRLARLTGDKNLDELAQKQLSYMASGVEQYPAGYSFCMMAFMEALYPSKEVVCVLKEKEEVQKVGRMLREIFMPNTAVLVKHSDDDLLSQIAGFTTDYGLKGNQNTFYICQNHACSAPFHDFETLGQRLT